MSRQIRSIDEDKKFKVIIIGDSSIGKTCLVERYISNRFLENPKPTIGAEITKQQEIVTIKATPDKENPGRHHSRQVEYWDLGGHKLFEQIRTSYLRGADGILLCFSLNDSRSIAGEDLTVADNHSIDRSLKEMSIALMDQVKEIPILLVGTKGDLEMKVSDREVDREVKKLRKEGLNILSYEIAPDNSPRIYGKYHETLGRPWETEKWRNGRGWLSTSSKTGENVKIAFEVLIRSLFEQSALTIEERLRKVPEIDEQKDPSGQAADHEKSDGESPRKKRDLERVW
ncbi:MAG: Rab family GTPase [Candidatus Odinarchaeota archaeon]